MNKLPSREFPSPELTEIYKKTDSIHEENPIKRTPREEGPSIRDIILNGAESIKSYINHAVIEKTTAVFPSFEHFLNQISFHNGISGNGMIFFLH